MPDSYSPIVAQAILLLSESVAAALDTLGEVVADRENRILELMLDADVLFETDAEGSFEDFEEDDLDEEEELEELDEDEAPAADAIHETISAAAKLGQAGGPPSSGESVAALEAAAVATVTRAMSQTLAAVQGLDELSQALLAEVASMWVDRVEEGGELAHDLERIEPALGEYLEDAAP